MRQTMEQHKAEYRARPLSERLAGVFAEVAAGDKPSPAVAAVRRVRPSAASVACTTSSQARQGVQARPRRLPPHEPGL